MDGITSAQYQARLAEIREDAAFRARQREEHEDAENRREEAAAAERHFYAEHGAWRSDVVRRQAFVQSQHEAAEFRRRDEQAAEKRADDLARLQMEGRRPRSLSEILASAAGTA
jgi:hypothetical protein